MPKFGRRIADYGSASNDRFSVVKGLSELSCIQHVPLDVLKFNGLTADFGGSFRTAERRSRLWIHAACLPETHFDVLELGRRTSSLGDTQNTSVRELRAAYIRRSARPERLNVQQSAEQQLFTRRKSCG